MFSQVTLHFTVKKPIWIEIKAKKVVIISSSTLCDYNFTNKKTKSLPYDVLNDIL